MDEGVRLGYSNTQAQRTGNEPKHLVKYRHLKCLLDWLGFSVPTGFWTLEKILEFFEYHVGIESQEWSSGRKNYEGYADSLTYENINIYYNGADSQGIHVDITGQGCRYIETFFRKRNVHKWNWISFLSHIVDMGANFTRVDFAIDDFDESFTVQQILEKCMNGEVTSKFKTWRPDGNFNMDGQASGGVTVYFGSPQSRLNIVFYEKNKQLGLDQAWTRTEIRFKKERANKIVEIILMNYAQVDSDYYDIGVLIAGVLKDNITFRDRSLTDSNKRRWPISEFWEKFLEDVKPIRIAEALPDRSVVKMRTWINTQVSKTIAILYFAYQDTVHDGKWLEEILRDGLKKMTSADKQIIDEYRKIFEGKNKKAIDNKMTYHQ